MHISLRKYEWREKKNTPYTLQPAAHLLCFTSLLAQRESQAHQTPSHAPRFLKRATFNGHPTLVRGSSGPTEEEDEEAEKVCKNELPRRCIGVCDTIVASTHVLGNWRRYRRHRGECEEGRHCVVFSTEDKGEGRCCGAAHG